MRTPNDDLVTDHDQVTAITERLRAEAEAVRTSFTKLRTDQDEAFARYAKDVHASLAAVQSDLEEACKRLDLERQQTRAKMRSDLDALVAKLHAQYDDLRVQLHLGEREGADLLDDVRSQAGEALERGKAAVRAARHELAEHLGSTAS